ncbi:MAG: DUF692 family protein [Candidatus Brocadiales bacterium]|nr:DUF692 family protein [Candidatus Brocadiales bacterium]
MTKIATPISHLFENEDHAKRIINYSNCLECRDSSINSTIVNQEVFHSELHPIHEFTKINFNYLKYIRSVKHDLKLITFHVASCCDKPYLDNKMFKIGGKEYSEKEMLKNAKQNFSIIKEVFGKEVKIAIENNNYYPTNAYKYVTEPEFISQIVRENNINFLMDIVHVKISSHNKKIDYEKYKDMLPLDRTIQLHICSCEFDSDYLAYDAHNYPKEEEFLEVKYLLDKLDIQYLTIEYYKDTECLIQSLKRAHELV